MSVDSQDRTTREKALRRNLILSAARSLFLERDYEATTMDDIASRAELSKATLYLYFRGKEDLYIALLHEGLHALNQRLREAALGPGLAPDRLRAFGRAYASFYREQPALFRIVSHFHTSQGRCSDEVTLPCEEKMIETVHMVAGLIASGLREGSMVTPLPVVEVASMFWASLYGMMHLLSYRTCRDCLGLEPDLDVITAVEHTWEVLLRGLLADGPPLPSF